MNTTADKLNRLTETKNAIKTAITAKGGAVNDAMPFREYASAIMSIPQEGGGGGSGIIDVTELPTENIDENAVYRVTESIQTEKTEVYLYVGTVVTAQQYLASLGVPTIPNIYAVDDLSNMLETDVQTFSAVNIYILKNDGIAYLNVPAYGGIITLGLFGFQAMGYDKGFTENVYAETENGVYTTLEAYKQVVRWFTRENAEWKEITAYINPTTLHGFTNTEVLSGDVTTRVFSGADIVSGECETLEEIWFLKRNGEYHTYIRPYMFRTCEFKTVTIPNFIENIYTRAFELNTMLTKVTFKGVPFGIESDVFEYCHGLATINVPWSEGEVEGAPWGATNATINYNYTEG